jgi:hypothetical protein
MPSRRLQPPSAAGLLALVALVALVGARSASATPVFAQATGLNCTACHTQMPALNAFGRYIQRTGYAAMSPKALDHAIPVFIFDIGTSYVHQTGQPATDDRINGPFHNTVFQANSAIGPDFTYKVEQLLEAQGQAGFLDQAWVGYHNLLNHHGHLFVGKLAALNLEEFGAPSVLYDVNDAGGDRLPGVAVGAHNYLLDYGDGRWGTKFSFVEGKTLAQVAYLGNSAPGRVRSATPTIFASFGQDAAVESGLCRSGEALGGRRVRRIGLARVSPGRRSFRVCTSDDYTVVAPYISKDPRPGSPGFRFEYSDRDR